MANGFEINISEAEFKSRSIEDQNWINFQGIVAHSKCLDAINNEGCEYSRKRRRASMLKLTSAISGGIAFALGVIYIVYQMTCR